MPDVVANFGGPLYIFPDAKAKPVNVTLRSFGATSGTVRLMAPAGWKVEPASLPVTFEKKGSEANVTFTVTPRAAASTGDGLLGAAAGLLFRVLAALAHFVDWQDVGMIKAGEGPNLRDEAAGKLLVS